ncbi:MAG: MFS transporter [Bryobacteraceae bacterium]
MAAATKSFGYWRKRILWGATAAYTIFYFCRVNISIAIPLLQKSLGASKTEIGFIASGLQISYGAGKFLNGVIGDRANPRYFMAAGLLLSGLANLAFSRSASLALLAAIWALNGWFQSMGFPAGARLLSHYYKPNEYGRSWTIFGCSHQVGACLILVAGGYLGLLGWRNIFAVPGLFAVAASAGVAWVLRDIPHKNKELTEFVPAPHRPALRAGLRRIVTNRFIWALAIGNLFLYIVRYGLLTWSASFLISNRGMSSVAAGWMLGFFELAGLFGGLSAGWLSDLKSHGRRGPVMTAYMLILTAAISCFWFAPTGNKAVIGLAIAACGFFVYGPLMLVSLAAAAYAGPELAASASGLAGLFGYIGATLAGAGLGATAEHAGWAAVFGLLIGAALLSTVCFAFTARSSAP